MSAESLLSALHKVKKRGPGKWVASCPGPVHRRGDLNPSLLITETTEARVLLWCPVGCSVQEILAALGLSFADLMPEPLADHLPKVRRPWLAADVLRAVRHEALVASIAASTLARGQALSDADRERLLVASERLEAAVEACNE